MKEKVLSMLKQSQTNSYLSGQEMCSTLGVSRTAIWKVMNQLKEEGYVIESVSNKGYSLLSCPDTLSEHEVKSAILTRNCLKEDITGETVLQEELGWEVLAFDTIESTNAKAKQVARDNDEQALLVLADEQTEGRGRRGRAWSSPKGTGIWMSMRIKPAIAPVRASMLTLVSALSIAKAIETKTGLTAQIKWPNDIIINGKKVCGILTEMSSEMDYIHYVVIGIGINVNTEEFPEELREIASSLALESNAAKKAKTANAATNSMQTFKRSELVAEVLHQFEQYYRTFLATEDMSGLQDEYKEALVHNDQRVVVLNGSTSMVGIARGIDSEGSLLLEREDGEIVPIISGEISVRGINGYV